MRVKKIILLAVLLFVGLFILLVKNNLNKRQEFNLAIPTSGPLNSNEEVSAADIPKLTTIAEGLDTPWAIAFLPDGSVLITERQGTVRLIDNDGKLRQDPILTVANSKEIGEGGLLGIVLHPDFAKASSGKPDLQNNYVYFYYTFKADGGNTWNRVVRMKLKDNKFGNEEVIVDNIPGNSNHNGGRIKFGPDKYLYITTGDAQDPSHAQDKNSLAGKILRVTDTGQPVSENPFGNRTFSYGHRNPQGIDWDKQRNLWSTEHGRSGVQSGLDELNLIEPGKNYGWDIIQGDQTKSGMERPSLNSGSTTWAPAGAAFIGDSLFFGGLRGQTLYEAVVKGKNVNLKEHFKGEFGRIREVIKGPDGMLYITTSNKDGRGIPTASDDRIIRINPNKL